MSAVGSVPVCQKKERLSKSARPTAMWQQGAGCRVLVHYASRLLQWVVDRQLNACGRARMPANTGIRSERKVLEKCLWAQNLQGWQGRVTKRFDSETPSRLSFAFTIATYLHYTSSCVFRLPTLSTPAAIALSDNLALRKCCV
jgi:hypothetical protein